MKGASYLWSVVDPDGKAVAHVRQSLRMMGVVEVMHSCINEGVGKVDPRIFPLVRPTSGGCIMLSEPESKIGLGKWWNETPTVVRSCGQRLWRW